MIFFKGSPYKDNSSLILVNLNMVEKNGIREIEKGSEIKFKNSNITIQLRDPKSYLESTIENIEDSNNLCFYHTIDSNVPFIHLKHEGYLS